MTPLACPFCGNDRLTILPMVEGSPPGTSLILCTGCSASVGGESIKSATLVWNRRALRESPADSGPTTEQIEAGVQAFRKTTAYWAPEMLGSDAHLEKLVGNILDAAHSGIPATPPQTDAPPNGGRWLMPHRSGGCSDNLPEPVTDRRRAAVFAKILHELIRPDNGTCNQCKGHWLYRLDGSWDYLDGEHLASCVGRRIVEAEINQPATPPSPATRQQELSGIESQFYRNVQWAMNKSQTDGLALAQWVGDAIKIRRERIAALPPSDGPTIVRSAPPSPTTTEERPKLDAILREAKRISEERGCTDGGCFIAPPKGQHTNGGCRCADRPLVKGRLVLLYKAVRRYVEAKERSPLPSTEPTP